MGGNDVILALCRFVVYFFGCQDKWLCLSSLFVNNFFNAYLLAVHWNCLHV